jgi:hypothetical protein
MDMNIRMKYWDRKFKTLLSYPQVCDTDSTVLLCPVGLRVCVDAVELGGGGEGGV